jgi:L-arabinonolactonase
MPTAASPSGDGVSPVAAQLAVDCRCRLGEGILWCERRRVLYWTDISGQRLWMHAPDSAATRHWHVPAQLGCLGLCDDGRLLLALAKALYVTDVEHAGGDDLPLQHLADVEPGVDHTRTNDGRSDRHGNFVFGTKSERDDTLPFGSFYQFSFRHGLRRLGLPRAAIPNSICFSRDGRTLYYCDSRVPEIRCCDYDADTAGVADARVFARVDGANAWPDGSIVDADGCLWNAQWGAARVVRYSPAGKAIASVQVPAKNPSCCAFGGAALDTLFITTAREDMSEAELAALPGAGSVWRASIAGVHGLPESRVAVA